jgi:hypothetical protein
LFLGSVNGTSSFWSKFFRIRLWSIVSICWWHAAVSDQLAATLLNTKKKKEKKKRKKKLK